MKLALVLARRGVGRTWPNPPVGAVLVGGPAGGQLVARGWTQPGGRPHAEAEALARAGGRARGATLYVTLEPCAHHGKTPPCADAIIAAGVARVVCATRDPDARVAGEGIARLRAAGIAVDEDLEGEEARWTMAGHVLRQLAGRPFVRLKIAVSADGRIAPGDGSPVWVTGEQARRMGHLLRARSDAILIGSGTLIADDPGLTCRLPGLAARSPVRVVLDTSARADPDAQTIRTAGQTPTWIMTAHGASGPGCCRDRPGLTHMPVEHRPGRGLAPEGVLAALAGAGITSVLLEGGPRIWRSFLDDGLVDEIVLFTGAAPLGESGLHALVDHGLDRITAGKTWRNTARRSLGADQMTLYRNRATVRLLQAER